MWVLGKLRESIESIPLELSRYVGKSKEDILLSSKTSISKNLHNNILTPDKIPEFCLPPQLRKTSPLLKAETTPPYLHGLNRLPKSGTSTTATMHVKKKDVKMKTGDTLVAWKATKKPLPFSAEGYGLVGLYESPNTRRKESLFHSKCPVYMVDRSTPAAAHRLAKETNLAKKILSGFFPLFSRKSLSETGSTESENSSSSDSSPISSPCVESSLYVHSGFGLLKDQTSCPWLTDSREDRGIWKTSPSIPPSLQGNSISLAPTALFPLDVLQCQERVQCEYVLPLQGHGGVRLTAEATMVSSNTFSSVSTVRVRVVSVEGLRECTGRRTLNCALNLCLVPGKMQQQRSATIRNCRSPVFNEDFYFTDLSREDLLELQLRLKVVDKPEAGTLRRETVIGVITKPLSQLLPLNKWVDE